MKASTGKKIIIGVDEVGRGPLAGPVVLGAFSCEARILGRFVFRGEKEVGYKLKDSKALTHKQREKWSEWIHTEASKGTCSVSLSWRTAKEIDSRGIAVVIREAVSECVQACAIQNKNILVLLDGGLKAPKEYKQKTIIKGDVTQPTISLASIVAKVARDSYISSVRGGKKYLFEKHKGYGTALHRKQILAHGMHVEHRRSFLSNLLGKRKALPPR